MILWTSRLKRLFAILREEGVGGKEMTLVRENCAEMTRLANLLANFCGMWGFERLKNIAKDCIFLESCNVVFEWYLSGT